MKLLKSKLDEMQEQKTAKVEIIGLYLTATALALSILIQAIMDVPCQQCFGEFIIFETLCLYIIAMSIKNGVWDRYFSPRPKNYFIGSMIAASIVGSFVLIMSILYGPIYSIAKDFFIWFSGTFGSCFVCSALLGELCKNRRKRLDQDPDYQELAKAIGVTVQTLKAIERGTYNPSIKLCRKICAVTGKTLDELFGNENQKIMIKI